MIITTSLRLSNNRLILAPQVAQLITLVVTTTVKLHQFLPIISKVTLRMAMVAVGIRRLLLSLVMASLLKVLHMISRVIIMEIKRVRTHPMEVNPTKLHNLFRPQLNQVMDFHPLHNLDTALKVAMGLAMVHHRARNLLQVNLFTDRPSTHPALRLVMLSPQRRSLDTRMLRLHLRKLAMPSLILGLNVDHHLGLVLQALSRDMAHHLMGRLRQLSQVTDSHHLTVALMVLVVVILSHLHIVVMVLPLLPRLFNRVELQKHHRLVDCGEWSTYIKCCVCLLSFSFFQ